MESMVERVERGIVRSARGPHDRIAPAERVATGLAGIGLLVLGRHTAWRVPAAVMAGAFLARAATASHPVTAALDTLRPSAPASLREGDGQHVDEAVTIGQPVQVVYTFWRNLSSISTACRGRIRATPLDDVRSHWQVLPESGEGEDAAIAEWTAELIDDIPQRLLTWRTTGNADVASMGHVRFSPATGDRGTEVRVHLHYAAPLGRVGAAAAALAGYDPAALVRESLGDIKRYLEATRAPLRAV